MLMPLQWSQNISIELLHIEHYQPHIQFIAKLQDIRKSNLAISFYFKKLLKKSYFAIKQSDEQHQISLLQLGLFAFKLQVLIKRKRVKQSKKLVFLLKHNYFQTNNKIQKQNKAVQFYKRKLTKKYFQYLFFCLICSNKQKTLQLYLKSQNFQQFAYILMNRKKRNLQNRLDKKQISQIVNKFYSQNTFKTCFKCFKLFTHCSKIQKLRKKIYLNKLFRQIINFKQTQDNIIQIFIHKKQQNIKKNVFQSLKNFKIDECYRLRLQLLFKKTFFGKLKFFIETKRSKKAIEQANQVILTQYIQRNNKIIQLKYFEKWIKKITIMRENNKQTKMLKQYSQIKQKQILLKKYFEKLLLNTKYNKVEKYYNKKITIKCFQSFKLSIIKESKKLQKVLCFIKNRQQGRYFKAIQIFNLQTQNKLSQHLLKKNWNKFTHSIINNYIQKNDKANMFNRIQLLKKAFYSFKTQVHLNKKTVFCAAYINLIRPLRNWRNFNKILRFINNRNKFILKKLFFQFKILTIRHQISKQQEQFQIKKSFQQYPFHSTQFKSMIQSKITEKSNMETSFFNCSIENSQRLEAAQKQSQDQDYIDRKVNDLLTKIKKRKNNPFNQ